jgi:hypothetical protein
MPSTGGVPAIVTQGEASQGFESPAGDVLYFVRSDDAPGLWSMPVASGRETFVLEGVRQNRWSVTNDGIVFMQLGRNSGIRYFEFASQVVSAAWPVPVTQLSSGFSVTRDGSSAPWAQTDVLKTELMIIDRWRR